MMVSKRKKPKNFKATKVKKSAYPFFSSDKSAAAFKKFSKTIAALRHPKTGCPWDLKQSHRSLRKYMIEEAYEAAEVMEETSNIELCEELGDVLLQVVLNAQLAAESGVFTLVDVIQSIDDKMKRRHPHVFGAAKGKKVTVDEVGESWKAVKAKEKGKKKLAASLFEEASRRRFPATSQARKIGEIAATVQFDWSTPAQVLDQLRSEIAEAASYINRWKPRQRAAPELADELGDIYFTMAQLCRHLEVDPEVAAAGGNQKFLRRFRKVEELARKQKIEIKAASMAVKERLWQEAKASERKRTKEQP